jgi:hypothetical protein
MRRKFSRPSRRGIATAFRYWNLLHGDGEPPPKESAELQTRRGNQTGDAENNAASYQPQRGLF